MSKADGFSMSWSRATRVLEETKVPRGHELVQMAREDIAPAIEALRRWYPDIVVGAESCHLTADFYHERTLLVGDADDRSIFPVVAKLEGTIVAMITFEKNERARTLTCRLGALDPSHRGGLALLGPMLLEKLGRAMGAELAYYFATLKSQHQQALAERMRYELVGIVPAFDRDMVREGDVKRVFEAIYAKVLVPAEAIEMPGMANLTTKTQAVWKALFGALPRQ